MYKDTYYEPETGSSKIDESLQSITPQGFEQAAALGVVALSVCASVVVGTIEGASRIIRKFK